MLTLTALILGCTSPGEVAEDTADAPDTAAAVDTPEPSEDTAADSDTAATTCTGGSGLSAGDHFIEQDGVPVWVRVPEGLPACAPLLLWGHGGQSPGSFFEDWNDPTGTNLHHLARTEGYVFVAPGVIDGLDQGHAWSYSDAAWIEPLIDTLWESLDLDRGQTWWVGNSAGGFIGLWLGLNAPSRFTAMGIISSGGLGSYFDYPDPAPERKLPFYLAHDPADQVVDYQLSVDTAARLEQEGHAVSFSDWTMTLQGHGWSDGLSEALLVWLAESSLPPE